MLTYQWRIQWIIEGRHQLAHSSYKSAHRSNVYLHMNLHLLHICLQLSISLAKRIMTTRLGCRCHRGNDMLVKYYYY